jgi:hypothetical protein
LALWVTLPELKIEHCEFRISAPVAKLGRKERQEEWQMIYTVHMWQICVEGLHELPSLLPGLCRCFSYFTTFKKIYNAILGQKITLSQL